VSRVGLARPRTDADRADGKMMVNPVDHVFREGDEIVIIAEEEIELG
jgi:hypothetical protein